MENDPNLMKLLKACPHGKFDGHPFYDADDHGPFEPGEIPHMRICPGGEEIEAQMVARADGLASYSFTVREDT